MEQNKISHISFSELERGWFTINDCYKTVNIHPLPNMEPLNSAEKHLITMAFYAIIFQGKKPKMFPKDVGGALAIFLYNNLTIVRDHCFERAFMDSKNLPTNIREMMKPKDECPQQLIDTAIELKKWANHLLEQNGMKEAFKKSTNQVTAEMAKNMGEIVANQMISELTKNYKNNSDSLIKKQLCKKHLFYIHQRFVQLRPSITHHVAIGLVAMKLEEDQFGLAHKAYRELQTWFASRMEFHGLALLEFKEFQTLNEPYKMFRNILLTTNAAQLIAILSALRIYLCAQSEGEVEVKGNKVVRDMTVWLLAQRLSAQSDDEMEGNEIVRDVTAWLLKLLEEPSIDLNIPKFNKYDQFLCKFSKCFSPKYLPWTAYKYNSETSALLLGYSQGFEPVEEELHGTYINPDRIESYRKDVFISLIFSEALDTVQNDILWRSKRKEGQVSVKLIGFLISECAWDAKWDGDLLYRELNKYKEKERDAERERLLALENQAKSKE